MATFIDVPAGIVDRRHRSSSATKRDEARHSFRIRSSRVGAGARATIVERYGVDRGRRVRVRVSTETRPRARTLTLVVCRRAAHVTGTLAVDRDPPREARHERAKLSRSASRSSAAKSHRVALPFAVEASPRRAASGRLRACSFPTAINTSTSKRKRCTPRGNTHVEYGRSQRRESAAVRAAISATSRFSPEAHGADASLRDDALLALRHARTSTPMPALEIAANDVKAYPRCDRRRDLR